MKKYPGRCPKCGSRGVFLSGCENCRKLMECTECCAEPWRETCNSKEIREYEGVRYREQFEISEMIKKYTHRDND